MEKNTTYLAPSMAYDAEATRLDLTTGMRQRTVRHVVIVLIVGFIIIALFNAQGFGKWAEKLPDNFVSEMVIMGSFTWHDLMMAIGTAEVFDTVRTAFQKFREVIWHLVPPQ